MNYLYKLWRNAVVDFCVAMASLLIVFSPLVLCCFVYSLSHLFSALASVGLSEKGPNEVELLNMWNEEEISNRVQKAAREVRRSYHYYQLPQIVSAIKESTRFVFHKSFSFSTAYIVYYNYIVAWLFDALFKINCRQSFSLSETRNVFQDWLKNLDFSKMWKIHKWIKINNPKELC